MGIVPRAVPWADILSGRWPFDGAESTPSAAMLHDSELEPNKRGSERNSGELRYVVSGRWPSANFINSLVFVRRPNLHRELSTC